MKNYDTKANELIKKFAQLDEKDFRQFFKGIHLILKGLAEILRGVSKAREITDKIGIELSSRELTKIFTSPKFSQVIVSAFKEMSPEDVGEYVKALFNLVMISQEMQKLDLKKASPETLQMLSESLEQIASFFDKIAKAKGGGSEE